MIAELINISVISGVRVLGKVLNINSIKAPLHDVCFHCDVQNRSSADNIKIIITRAIYNKKKQLQICIILMLFAYQIQLCL